MLSFLESPTLKELTSVPAWTKTVWLSFSLTKAVQTEHAPGHLLLAENQANHLFSEDNRREPRENPSREEDLFAICTPKCSASAFKQRWESRSGAQVSILGPCSNRFSFRYMSSLTELSMMAHILDVQHPHMVARLEPQRAKTMKRSLIPLTHHQLGR